MALSVDITPWAVAALLIGCYLCDRAAAKTDIKTQEL